MCLHLWEICLNRDIKCYRVYEIIVIHWEYNMVNVQCIQEVTLSKITVCEGGVWNKACVGSQSVHVIFFLYFFVDFCFYFWIEVVGEELRR